MGVLKGIDVSSYQGTIDWDKVKPNIDFAILRCGWGSDATKQDDGKFKRNVAECTRLGIPFGIYLYSYADTDAKFSSEIKHVLRLIEVTDAKPFCVYYDMEDSSTTKLGKATLTSKAKAFCKAIKDAGYNAGVYANQYWCRTYLDIKAISDAGNSVWCAKYSTSKPNISAPYDIWQYSSSGKVNGISGNVDMNYMYNDIRGLAKDPEVIETPVGATPPAESVYVVKKGDTLSSIAKKHNTTYQKLAEYNGISNPNVISVGQKIKIPTTSTTATKKSNEQIAKEVVQGKWGNGTARKKALEAAGYVYSTIQKIVNKLLK